jgi:cyclophilin family peptidyl-prolyl cis-trans isomerase/HEAT repeat protein
MRKTSLVAIVFALASILALAAPGPASGKSRYDKLLRTAEGRAKLSALAKLENADTVNAPVLARYATDKEPLVRLRVAEALGRIGDPRGVPLLAKLTKDKDLRVVETAAYSLGLFADESVLEPLRACALAQHGTIKARAIEALGRTGLKGAGTILVPYLKNFNGSVRAQAAVALAISGDSAAANECEILMHDPDPHVLACAAYAMGRLGYKGGAELITPLLAHQNAEVKLRAAEALGRLKHGKSASAIAPLTKDPDRWVAIKAAEALGRIASGKGEEALETLLASNDDYLKTVALQGLATIGGGGSFEPVCPLLDDPSPMVRRAALQAAASTGGGRSREFLLKAFEKGTIQERSTALELLGSLSKADDLPLLAQTLQVKGDLLLQEGAATGLGNWKHPDDLAKRANMLAGPSGVRSPIEILVSAVDGPDPVVASIAAESIGKVGPLDAIADLVKIFPKHNARVDGDRKVAILEAIGARARELTPEKAAQFGLPDFLSRAATEPDPRVARAAASLGRTLGMSIAARPAPRDYRGSYPWGEPSLPLGQRAIRIDTRRGSIEVLLYGDDAPNAVESILYLAKKGFFKGLTFHRVVPAFVIQGGCPRGDGWGDAGYFLKNEINLHRYGRGTVGMADSGKDTAGSQFFITHTPQPHLNGRYTIIGKVTKGMDVVDSIEEGDTFDITVIK